MSELLYGHAGRCRSLSTTPGLPRRPTTANKDLRYPADPHKVEEIISLMRTVGDDVRRWRLRGFDRGALARGSHIHEVLAPAAADRARGKA